MAEIEEPRFTTLAERIAALNQQKNFQSPPAAAGKRPPPLPPPVRALTDDASRTTSEAATAEISPALPPRPVRAATERLPPPLPRRTGEPENGGDTGVQPPAPSPGRLAPPPLPARNSPQPTPPKLPSRRPSAQTLSVRRNSNASDVSLLSTVSSLSLNQTKSATSNEVPQGPTPRRLPPPLEQAKLPPLPPTRRELDAKAKEEAEKESASATPPLPPRRIAEPPRPSLPPRLPSRPAKPPADAPVEEPAPPLPARRLPPPPASSRPKADLDSGFQNGARKPSPPPAPPPVPVSSRPTLAQIDAVAARGSSATVRHPPAPPAASRDCLTCRDFSAPDTLASQHPTSTLPHHDPIGHLAHVLCSPFSSPTDKARAIFTWCHHNIVYDVHGFFNNCIPRGQTPAETIFSGKAVCEGYARVYEAIATRAGLACVVVTGHGKGYGFTPVKAGQRPPPRDPTGHAWNAVRIDGGAWKLIDACWGAGALCNNEYSQRFAPEQFTMSNERFGLRHYPADDRHWYRRDGRAVSWEEYIVGPVGDEPAEWMGDATREGLDESNFAPAQKRLSVGSGGLMRFQFAKVCEHWTPERNGLGKQMLFGLKINGVDGRKDDILPLETDGFWYYVDVNARDLGAPGQTVVLVAFETIDGQSARGLTKEEWLRRKGRCGYSIAFLVRWELVA
ncbi:uncharacterized protein THITE_2043857 [Thermothielavioides terrestris NRRL 8126]|uniref:Transglutaminase-like domain-containing protein n=1 Tax=Thermothielavioides terrestris (strain ATCC 38088 / NRRL 8126) TaxID=578455 RepID=G2QYH1_THETT|nr:uncharacterized protein THITE_2043857 [Thermothielavioides terrestris NRRL 8126]AEO67066.1 hypothetical protein THITE_2043857 [Thermothielavioides terrestris NRRL 8126]